MPSTPDSRPFLTAAWRYLAILNYEVPPALLQPLVPSIAIPGHRDFDEVNLRFYVRRRGEDGEWRRAVVFVRELVPRRAIALVARWLYNEPYTAPGA